MLTEAEKKWLEKRKDKGEYNFYYCQYCNKIPSIVTGGLCAGPCPMYPGGFEYEDAAEFEARVVVRLAKSACLVCPDNRHGGCPTKKMAAHGREHVEACRLKHARLAVEAEMEKEEK